MRCTVPSFSPFRRGVPMDTSILIGVLIGGALLLLAAFLLWRARRPDASGVAVRGTVTSPVVTSHAGEGALRLSVMGGEQDNPSEADIAAAISGLAAGSDDAVILEAPYRNGSYLQAYRQPDGAYRVEYRDGMNQRHYRAEPDPG